MLLLVVACRGFSMQFMGGDEAKAARSDRQSATTSRRLPERQKDFSFLPVQGCLGSFGPKVFLADTVVLI